MILPISNPASVVVNENNTGKYFKDARIKIQELSGLRLFEYATTALHLYRLEQAGVTS